MWDAFAQGLPSPIPFFPFPFTSDKFVPNCSFLAVSLPFLLLGARSEQLGGAELSTRADPQQCAVGLPWIAPLIWNRSHFSRCSPTLAISQLSFTPNIGQLNICPSVFSACQAVSRGTFLHAGHWSRAETTPCQFLPPGKTMTLQIQVMLESTCISAGKSTHASEGKSAINRGKHSLLLFWKGFDAAFNCFCVCTLQLEEGSLC